MKTRQVIAAVAAIAFIALALLKILSPGPLRPAPPAAAAHPRRVPRLPAPQLPVGSLPNHAETNGLALTNAYQRYHRDVDRPKLTAEQVEVYLRENHRSVISLLAASRASGDKSYLCEAMEKFPTDPRVAFDAYFFSGPYNSGKPATEELRKWLENFKQVDPGNALPNYLAARDDFKAGQTDLAVQELEAATGKSNFQDYLLDSLQSTEEAYRSAGYSEAEAKSIATWDLLLPHLMDLKRLGQNLVDLAGQYRQSGDAASAEAVWELGITLGDRFNGPGQFPLINTLVGIAIQRNILESMNPNDTYRDTGLTVQNQLDALNRYRDSLRSLGGQTDDLLSKMSDPDLVNYYDRLRLFGEISALQWAAGKYGAP